MDGDTDVTPKTARRRNQFMTTHSRRGVRSVTACQFVALVLIGLWGKDAVLFAQTFEVVTSFVPMPNGQYPQAGLIQARDGSFYGTTSGGGAHQNGTVFKLDAAGRLTTLHSFAGGSEGQNPLAGLIQARDGSFYGTTSGGGIGNCFSGCGTVFKMDAAGTLTTLHSFNDSDGRYPVAELMQASDGRIYGTTYQGGASENGTVFRIDAAGRLTTLHSFTSSNGG